MSMYSLLALFCDNIVVNRVFDKCRRLSLKSNRTNLKKITDNIKKLADSNQEIVGTEDEIKRFNICCRVLTAVFQKEWKAYGQNNLWIIKPTGVSRGSGITILQDIKKIY